MSVSTPHWFRVIVLYACASTSVLVCGSNFTCPTWFFYDNATKQCECGKTFEDKLICNGNTSVWIANGFCATTSVKDGLYYAGYCPFTHRQNSKNRIFSELPSDPDMLDDVMCGPYKRKGLLCGECIEGYGPTVYSFDMKCADCSIMSPGYAVTLYLLLELCPITVLFIVLIVFRLNITSGPLLGYLVFCQNFSLWQQNKFYYFKSHASTSFRLMFKLTLTLFQLWSFQFLQSVIPPFCISEKLTGVQIQMLSLVSATYPVILVIITCSLMELHARNCRILHILWKPFRIILNKTNIAGVTSDAVIHAFASIIFLSNTGVSLLLGIRHNNIQIQFQSLRRRSLLRSIHRVVWSYTHPVFTYSLNSLSLSDTTTVSAAHHIPH
jgi:hypothetical protein